MRLRRIGFCALLFLMIPFSLQSQAMRNQQKIDSARLFVQKFYDWYVPLAHKKNKESTFNIAIKIKPGLFGKTLLTAIRKDAVAQSKASDIVGLDYDPFLCAQDPSDRYDVGKIYRKVGKIYRKGDRYFAEIYSTRDGIRSNNWDVLVELKRRNTTWIFVNFYDPSGSDLLSELGILKTPREKEWQ